MTYPALFFFLLPLLASLGPGLIAQEDIKNGFNLRLVQQSLKAYMQSNLLVTYLYGFITAALPLSLDYLLVLWLFPNVTPNMVLNRGDGVGLGPIGSTLTYWADQYYKKSNTCCYLVYSIDRLHQWLICPFQHVYWNC